MFLLLFSLIVSSLSAPLSDVVTNLPGLNFVPSFNSYSGYLSASSTKMFHYWLTESEKVPSQDPLILWLNGGPGCSSLGGLIEELGPFKVMDNGQTVYNNQWSWNTFANVLFIESPAGVGFSYATNGITETTDDEVSENNYNALVDFLSKFPEYLGRDIYITGESYGGVYLPTLAVRMLNDTTNFPNFKGMAVGNGALNFPSNYKTMVPLYYYHGLVRDELYNRIKTTCCHNNIEECDIFGAFFNTTCEPIIVEALDGTDDLDPYNLYSTCYVDGEPSNKRMFTENALRTVAGLPHKRRGRAASLPLCAQTNNTAIYLNRVDVRRALHIPSSLPRWSDCSDSVTQSYKTTHMDMTPEFQTILKSGVKILVYNGDVDTVCNHVMNMQFITNLNLTIAGSERVNQPWFYNGETPNVAGFVLKHVEQLDFVTVRGSGHFVPEDKPKESLQMIYNWIKGKDYSQAVPMM